MSTHIVLIGFMGAGKTTVGRRLAALLERPFIDLDHVIESNSSQSIVEIFAQGGEAQFRKLETEFVRRAVEGPASVLAVGGGALQHAVNVRKLRRRGELVWLRAPLEKMVARAIREGGRPLLDSGRDVKALYESRKAQYSLADVVVDVGDLAPDEAARAVYDRITGAKARRGAPDGSGGIVEPVQVPVDLSDERSYDVHVGAGLLGGAGRLCHAADLPETGLLVTNERVGGLYAGAVLRSLSRSGRRVPRVDIADGEEHKTVASLNTVYDAALKHKMGRDTAFYALGGGVVGDVAGFAAATYLRGVPYVQLPTTLLAQVDSSVGGKTGVNLPQGKNLVGAFHQPRVVIADVDTLETLPAREFASGMAEVIKYGLIVDAPLLDYLEDRRERLLRLDRAALTTVVARSCTNKAAIVAADERETSGRRELLNFGHTVGHGLEALGGYTRWLHGEAVAVGMVTAALLSRRAGALSDREVTRLVGLLRAYDLPVSPGPLDMDLLQIALQRDKKARGGRLRFALLRSFGSAYVSDEVTDACIFEAIQEQQRL